MEFHEIAKIFPLMEGTEFDALIADIKKNGLLEPIWLYEDKILDGRNRYKACQLAGIEPQFVEYTKDDPFQFVISKNMHRRHLDESQRAVIAARIANMPLGGALYRSANLPTENHISQSDVAKMFNVSERTIRSVKAVERDVPELIPEIENGNISVNKALEKIKDEKKKVKIETARKRIAEEVKERPNPPIIIYGDCKDFAGKCDLLITDPPYMTDVENIKDFARWLPEKLQCVKSTGFAFIFIGAYPQELAAYLNIAMPTQVLVWTYRNTLGAAPKNRYKLNWQAILFYRMQDSPELNCLITNELWSVQDVNAPDGRLDGRYHTWEKPMELAERLIRHTTKPGDVILDCFAGTGTFLLAGARLGRQAIGYEIDKKMIDIAVKRGCKLG